MSRPLECELHFDGLYMTCLYPGRHGPVGERHDAWPRDLRPRRQWRRGPACFPGGSAKKAQGLFYLKDGKQISQAEARS